MKNAKRQATLKDIAEKTGYSINTISRALRDKDDIAADTRARIQQTAQEMGYINNMIASSLRLGYTSTIAVILGDVSNPHFAIMMKEIEERARELGYSSFLINTNEDEALERQAINDALNKNVDGIILCPVQKSEDNIRFLQSTHLPFVLIGRRFQEIDTSYVICNDELGGYLATKHLLDQGHRRILMLHAPTYISSSRERLEGYQRAYREAGLVPDAALMREIPVTAKGCTEVLGDIVGEGAGFTAIFAFSDMLAWDVWSCLKQQGCQVPEQISIVGFDHIQSRLSIPYQLSTISSYKARMSLAAVEILAEQMRGDRAKPAAHLVIDTALVEGDTVARHP